VLSQFRKDHPSGNLKFNDLSIFECLKFRILMEKNLLISLKQNFTPNTLGCHGLTTCSRPQRKTEHLFEEAVLACLEYEYITGLYVISISFHDRLMFSPATLIDLSRLEDLSIDQACSAVLKVFRGYATSQDKFNNNWIFLDD